MCIPNSLLYPCIMPSIPEDYIRARASMSYLFDFLPIDRIIFIGPDSLKSLIENDKKFFPIDFLDESELLPLKTVKKIYDPLLSSTSLKSISSVNWYYQQFLKMAYSKICESEYYLCWDSDTIPMRKIDMFSAAGKPYFDIKPEYNSSYFITLQRLFGYNKVIEGSFISEHMLFKTDFMLELINEIEKLDFDGKFFYEKILSAIGSDNLKLGFSEFETFGTFVAMRHQSDYMLRHWKSFRNTNFFIDRSQLIKEDIDWLSKDYDAATFEKYHETENSLTELFRNPYYREKLSPKQFYTAILESGIMGEYVDGKIKIGDNFFPV